MKTKIIILSAIFAVISFAVASKTTGKSQKLNAKQATTDTRAARGLSMDDKDQFN